MKKLVGTTILLMVLASMICGIVAAESIGPAPSSGDGISEGSGFDQPNWQNEDNLGIGPAPNSGDGIPDSSGFE
ncbi:MAG: hypothetical protein P8X84_05175 [Candidatus Bathyarchaeota archaeon]|jgi:hypothetical protein